MPKRRIDDDLLYAHFVTFSWYHRRRLLDHDRAKKIVLGVLNSQLAQQSARCVGYVVMPNHVHAVVWFPQPNQLSTFVKHWKQRSSLSIKELLTNHLPGYAERIAPDDPVWQRKYYVFHIHSSDKLEQKLTYMHLNPVRAGLVGRAVDWQWSSARWYEERKSVGVPITWVE